MAWQSFGPDEAPCFLLITGWFSDLTLWPDALCHHLASRGLRVLRYDHRDSGLSTRMGSRRYSLDDLADDAAALLDVLGVPEAHAVGMAMGGTVAQLLALRHPQRVLTLTLIGCSTGSGHHPPPNPEVRAMNRARIPAPEAARRAHRRKLFAAMAGGNFDALDYDGRERESMARGAFTAAAENQLLALTRAADRSGHLRRVQVPALVVWGPDDPLIPLAAAQELKQALPQARLMALPGAGHGHIPLDRITWFAHNLMALANPETDIVSSAVNDIPASVNRQVQLVRRPAGEPREEDFLVVDAPREVPGANEVLLETLWLSLDPYMRLRMDDRASYAPPVQLGDPMVGGAVARVLASNVDAFQPGDLVEGRIGWQSHPVVQAAAIQPIDLPPATAHHALGLLGMPSLTAYHGLLNIGQPKPGETVVVGAATGAVGSVAGQIAKLKGCTVIGIAGGAAKCRVALEEYGFHACVDHRSPTFALDLAAACPNGVDVYFENIGGAVLAAVLPLLNTGARIPLCGLISQYNTDRSGQMYDQLPGFLDTILTRRLTVRGFIISDHADVRVPFKRDMLQWIKEDAIHYRTTVTQGLAQAPAAFIRLLRGENIGKMLVQVPLVLP